MSRANLDRDAVGEVEGLGALVLDQRGQHRHLLQQRADVAEDNAGLLAIGRQDQQRASLTRCEVLV